jgi:hypothetical protein
MADPSPAEKFLADWAKDYVEADPEDRLSMDVTVERCLGDAQLAEISKDEVLKAADGDVAAYLTRALKEFKAAQDKEDKKTQR